MNHVLLLTKNNLELTKRAIDSVRSQDIDTKIQVYDNESPDGTQAWLDSQPDIINQSSGVDLGVSGAWNFVLEILFEPVRYREGHKPQGWGVEHVLVINNDTILSPWFYSELLSYDKDFITGVSVDDMAQISERPHRLPLSPHPDFSAFLIRRAAWERIGPFDERMKHYASDLDYHVRAHRAGVGLWKANVPFYHERSSTLRNADPVERAEIEAQANRDREMFRYIYGCIPGEKGYEELFK